MADNSIALPFAGGRLKLVDLGDGTFALATSGSGGGGASEVTVTNFPATQAVTGPLTDAQLRATAVPVSGPLTNAQLTAVTGTATATTVVIDPAAASATVVGLLRGILQALNTIATNTTPTP